MKKKTRKEVVKEMLFATAEERPNSVIVDLLAHFTPEVIMKLIELYSGEQLTFPKIDTIWKHYRNKIIRDTLDVKNTQEIRKQLANYFKISHKRVNDIYREEKLKVRKVGTRFLKGAAKRIYIDKSSDTLKDIYSDQA